jgi:predicted lipoprotein with Yx(FWY)xxD motif
MTAALTAAGIAIIAADVWLILAAWTREAILVAVLGAVGILLSLFALAAGPGGIAGEGALIFAVIGLALGAGLYGVAVTIERWLDEERPERASKPHVGRRAFVLPLPAIVAALAIVALGGCGASATRQARAPSPAGSHASAQTPGVGSHSGIVVTQRTSQYGRILTDGANHTIYLFTRDKSTTSTCYGACATVWPPVLTNGAPRPAGGLPAARFGTTRRSDGTWQVTYAGHPLYYYVNDVRPGQILCQNVDEFGGTWLVISPAGTAIH